MLEFTTNTLHASFEVNTYNLYSLTVTVKLTHFVQNY
jgi:hypothetical protein